MGFYPYTVLDYCRLCGGGDRVSAIVRRRSSFIASDAGQPHRLKLKAFALVCFEEGGHVVQGRANEVVRMFEGRSGQRLD